MDLPQIGAHCSLPSCNLLDFLPITCRCNQSFCSEHISPDLHECPAFSRRVESTKSSDPLPRCFLDGCQRPRLRNYTNAIDETCSHCHQSFCAEHRHPDTHMCPTSPAQAKPTPSLKPRVPGKFKLPPRKAPSDPIKFAQWQKMELMKMRHRAAPGDPRDKGASPPPDERIHVKILTEQAERMFWFRKTIVAGRALDLLVAQLGLSFPADQALKLGTVSGSDDEQCPILLQNDQLLVKQVEDGNCLSIYSTL
ncbi:hypothetical protein CPB84DRAFT_1715087 [Gymnopilus junonius]|uniref:AN1-type domain-containing protein n=1 Tax=Gymnopilus junonius TaxID=109634 RepID=A0A9P5NBL2_GYMJU|nr:hypothetical protein CPB84DRAFT_1715087 [Gymnopilus junonius]